MINLKNPYITNFFLSNFTLIFYMRYNIRKGVYLMNTKKVVLTNGKVWTGELSEDFNDSLSVVIENDKISSIA